MKINLEKSQGLYIAFLALLAATPALSTDMYLAAIPKIAEGWGVGKDTVNLTLVLWFASFSFFILVSGSLSDKYGRKPVLTAGLSLFVISSFLCAFAGDVYQLIVFRILQGAGAGAPSAVVMAIVRDKYDGRDRQRAFAYIMTIVALAPMIAPMIGALLLKFFSWRFIFLSQALLVSFSFVLSFSFIETNIDKLDTPLHRLVTRYTVHFHNRNFMFAALSMGLLVVPFYGFIAFSPVYYISMNGLSEQAFSILFGVNAFAFMIGARASTFIVRKTGEKRAITTAIIGCITAGAGVVIFAQSHYLFFTVFMLIFTFSTGVSRPVSGALIVGLVDTDVGSASSFLVFYQFMSGALCMALVTRHWADPALFYGGLTLTLSVIVLLLWRRVACIIDPDQ
ncbi:MAG: multidrug transporter [Denitrovibrio sp.]|nr:MAG: multidrug transporter [Denitrovibrio sp.]